MGGLGFGGLGFGGLGFRVWWFRVKGCGVSELRAFRLDGVYGFWALWDLGVLGFGLHGISVFWVLGFMGSRVFKGLGLGS